MCPSNLLGFTNWSMISMGLRPLTRKHTSSPVQLRRSAKQLVLEERCRLVGGLPVGDPRSSEVRNCRSPIPWQREPWPPKKCSNGRSKRKAPRQRVSMLELFAAPMSSLPVGRIRFGSHDPS